MKKEMMYMVLADIHGSIENLDKAIEYARKEGIKSILLLGDLPAYGEHRSPDKNIRWCEKTLDKLVEFNLLAIPGNCDSPEIIAELDERGISLHKKIKVYDDTSLIGFGGSTPTPYQTPFELREDEIHENLEKLMKKTGAEKKILVVHQPPWNTRCDVTNLGVHAGSTAIRGIIEKYQPDLVICSHIHESRGKDFIGKTRIINTGALLDGYFSVLDSENLTVELHDLSGK
ncbi:MAG: metallophosphoesterase [Candidatus Altiarchaeota archaeon]|nr:metallophosphoesterase [Candidatus Altiarchaeota archaeon]